VSGFWFSSCKGGLLLIGLLKVSGSSIVFHAQEGFVNMILNVPLLQVLSNFMVNWLMLRKSCSNSAGQVTVPFMAAICFACNCLPLIICLFIQIISHGTACGVYLENAGRIIGILSSHHWKHDLASSV
jgi:hypothetical protein